MQGEFSEISFIPSNLDNPKDPIYKQCNTISFPEIKEIVNVDMTDGDKGNLEGKSLTDKPLYVTGYAFTKYTK